MKLNKHQLNAAKDYQKSNRSLVVRARAGSGKTSLLLAMQKIGKSKRSLMVAYTNAAKDELIRRMPELNNRVRTTYQLGFAALRKCVEVNSVDTFKYYNLVRDVAISDNFISLCAQRNLKPNKFLSSFALNTIVQNISLCFSNLVFDEEGVNEIVRRSYFFSPFLETYLVHKAMNRGMRQVRDEGIVHFSDMISWVFSPYCLEDHSGLFSQYPVLFLDEAQDVSPAQMKVIRNTLTPNGQLVAVGDERQCIYGFNGASENNLDAIIEEYDAVDHTMPICYRCGDKILEEAQKIVPDIVGTGKESRVLSHDFETAIEHLTGNAMVDTIVACRTNAPLMKLATFLLDRGIPFNFKTPKLGETLKNKVRGYKEEIEFIKLSSTLDEDLEEAEYNNNAYLADILSCLVSLLNLSCAESYSDLLKFITKLFYKETSKIVLGSIHSFKGSEAHTCFIWGTELIPHHKAETEAQLRQEDNLLYVAQTRAKELLVYVALDG